MYYKHKNIIIDFSLLSAGIKIVCIWCSHEVMGSGRVAQHSSVTSTVPSTVPGAAWIQDMIFSCPPLTPVSSPGVLSPDPLLPHTDKISRVQIQPMGRGWCPRGGHGLGLGRLGRVEHRRSESGVTGEGFLEERQLGLGGRASLSEAREGGGGW